MVKKIWECKIGIVEDEDLPPGSDLPMRRAVEAAFMLVTGKEADFTFSGWGCELSEAERDVVSGSVGLRQEPQVAAAGGSGFGSSSRAGGS